MPEASKHSAPHSAGAAAASSASIPAAELVGAWANMSAGATDSTSKTPAKHPAEHISTKTSKQQHKRLRNPLRTAAAVMILLAVTAGAVLFFTALYRAELPQSEKHNPEAPNTAEQNSLTAARTEYLADKHSADLQIVSEKIQHVQTAAEQAQTTALSVAADMANFKRATAIVTQEQGEIFAKATHNLAAAGRIATALQQRIDAYAPTITEMKTEIAVNKRQNEELLLKINSLNEKITTLSQSRRQEYLHWARLKALQNLQTAVTHNLPYKTELQHFNAAMPSSLAAVPIVFARAASAVQTRSLAEALAEYQETGLPPITGTAAYFRHTADTLALKWQAREQGEQSAALWQKIQSAVAPWVSIRPQGQVAGTGSVAVLARIEQALQQDKAALALAEIQTLPQQEQNDIADIADMLRLRIAADAFFLQTAEQLFREAGNSAAAL